MLKRTAALLFHTFLGSGKGLTGQTQYENIYKIIQFEEIFCFVVLFLIHEYLLSWEHVLPFFLH